MKRFVPYVIGLVFAGGFACDRDHTEERDDENFREDVVVCEEAVAHLASCCPGLTAEGEACRFHHYRYDTICGCESTGGGPYTHEDVWPIFETSESRWIVEQDCAAVSCDDMKVALAAGNSRYTSSAGACEYE